MSIKNPICAQAPHYQHPALNHLFDAENAFFQAALMPQQGDRILLIDQPAIHFQAALNGVFVHLLRQNQNQHHHIDVQTLPENTPWVEHCFDSIVAAHLLDSSNQISPTLAEWRRITRPQGKLILFVANPHAIWQLSATGRHLLPTQNSPEKLIAQAEQIGWQLEQCRFLLHTPVFRQPENAKYARLLAKILALMLPQTAAVYGLVFTKQTACLPPPKMADKPFIFSPLSELQVAQKTTQRTEK